MLINSIFVIFLQYILSTSAEFPTDTVIHGYRLIERKESGAESVVYKALGENGDIRAIKIFRSFDSDKMRYIASQLQFKLKTNHPNILNFEKVVFEKNYIIGFMKYIEMDLFGYKVKNDVIDPFIVKLIFKQILDGLNFLHSINIIHNDLRMENVLFDGEFAYIIDFGFCSTETTISGVFKVDYYYKNHIKQNFYAPEIRLKIIKTYKSDIWSLGVLIYQFVSKTRFNEFNYSFAHFSKSMKEILSLMIQKEIKERKNASELLFHSYFDKLYDFVECLVCFVDFFIQIGKFCFSKSFNKLICISNNECIYSFECLCHEKIVDPDLLKHINDSFDFNKISHRFIVRFNGKSVFLRHATYDILKLLKQVFESTEIYRIEDFNLRKDIKRT